MARKSRKNLQTAEAIVLPEISESLDKKMASGHETDGYLY